MNTKIILCALLLGLGSAEMFAQEGGSLSGNLEANANFFMRDTLIGAANTPQYDNQLSGADAWLNLNYRAYGFDFGLRFDLYNNSNLRNPLASYTAQGLGRWYVKKKFDRLGLYAGYIYDQIGSGIVFRAYEARYLFIDNALLGLQASYEINDHLSLKAFTGRQKQQIPQNGNLVQAYDQVIKGASMDAFFSKPDIGLSYAPGIGIVNRTLDDETMNTIVSQVNTYAPIDSFIPRYNVYAATYFHTLAYKNFSWYFEGAYKSAEAIFDPNAERSVRLPDGSSTTALGKLDLRDGSVLYSSLSYGTKGLGITLQGKRTENFSFRVSPLEVLNRGLISFLPPMARQNTYRLTARYNAATQELGELAYQADINYQPNKRFSFFLNLSNITDLNNKQLYREIHVQGTYKHKRLWSLTAGFQTQQYNQEVFEQKPQVPLVETLVPYVDLLYRFNRKNALRIELQYMHTEEDYGSWIFAQAEYSIAPRWSFTVSDMYNVDPKKTADPIHYPTVSAVFTHDSNRFSVGYIKQVEGVVCTGGICRLEPAFSGVRMSVNSVF